MRLFDLPEPEALAALRALKGVALANGELADDERLFLEIAATLYGVETDVDALPPIAMEELAASIQGSESRLRLLQAGLVVAIADGEASLDEWRALDALRGALRVDDSMMKVFRRVAEGHLGLARVELLRRLSSPILKSAYAADGLRGCYRFVRAATRRSVVDPAVAARYQRLGELPPGALGRDFFEHCRRRDFGLPGEPNGLAEITVHHDFLHVLTGYETDPAGELQIGAFTAGMRRVDPFPVLFFVLLQFHAGVAVTYLGPPERGKLDPVTMTQALERGAAMSIDLAEGWDFWAVVDRPVDELRQRYGIAPA